jgi:beta-lactamase superfamily II metal-dependent hydrolase
VALKRTVATVLLSLALGVSAWGARSLEIYFIDVEGGESTLIVTPAGESMLVDAGYAGRDGRDPDRIIAAATDAGLKKIDYLLITHFHPDHAGGVADLASRISIGTFIDYGEPLGTPYGADRMATRTFEPYEVVRAEHQRLRPEPGDHLPLKGVEAVVVSAGGDMLPQPLPGAGQQNAACANVEDQPPDGTENYRSLGVLLQLGAFRFLDLGDLSDNTLATLVCPRNLVGRTSVYLVAHHGDYDTNLPAVYAAIRPRVAVMNNGVVKGGSPDAFRTLHSLHGLEDLWQLHASRNAGAQNSPDDFIANTDGTGDGNWIKLSASDDGSFRVVNSRTGFARNYLPAH